MAGDFYFVDHGPLKCQLLSMNFGCNIFNLLDTIFKNSYLYFNIFKTMAKKKTIKNYEILNYSQKHNSLFITYNLTVIKNR